jgi:cysteine synthase
VSHSRNNLQLSLTNISTLFGGPSQPQPLDERGGIYRAKLLAQENETCLNANQYENEGACCSLTPFCIPTPLTASQNWQSHVQWTGPQIHQQLPGITLMCAGLGTAGTMTGLGQYFKQAKPLVTRLG